MPGSHSPRHLCRGNIAEESMPQSTCAKKPLHIRPTHPFADTPEARQAASSRSPSVHKRTVQNRDDSPVGVASEQATEALLEPHLRLRAARVP